MAYSLDDCMWEEAGTWLLKAEACYHNSMIKARRRNDDASLEVLEGLHNKLIDGWSFREEAIGRWKQEMDEMAEFEDINTDEEDTDECEDELESMGDDDNEKDLVIPAEVEDKVDVSAEIRELSTGPATE